MEPPSPSARVGCPDERFGMSSNTGASMKRLIVTGVVATLAACQGQIIEPGGGSSSGTGTPVGVPPGGDPGSNPNRPQGVECKTIDPGESPVRRMSNAEYKNTISDLLGSSK